VTTQRFLHTNKTGKVVPLKEGFYDLKAIPAQQVEVFIDAVGNKNIFKRFPFAGNLLLGVTVCGFEVVIKIDKRAIQRTVIRKNFRSQQARHRSQAHHKPT
jgi:hypothetical protein